MMPANLQTPSNDPNKVFMAPPAPSKSEATCNSAMAVSKKALKVATFPFFIRGCQGVYNNWNSHNCLSGVNLMLSLGCILISVPGIAINAGGALVAASSAAVAGGAKGVHALEKLKPDEYRAYLTQEFVKDLSGFMKDMTADQKEFFKANLDKLVGMEVLSIAFLDRKNWGEKLTVQGTEIEEKNLQDTISREYFRDLITIKQNLCSLYGTPADDAQVWNIMLADLANPDALKEDLYRHEKITKILEKVTVFCERTNNDEVFQKACQEFLKM